MAYGISGDRRYVMECTTLVRDVTAREIYVVYSDADGTSIADVCRLSFVPNNCYASVIDELGPTLN